MNTDQVYAQFSLFAGLSTEAQLKWTALCDAAILKIRGLLRPEVTEDDPRLTLAAAAEAYHQYTLAQGMGSAQSFRVGDISVSEQSGGGNSDAEKLRDEMLANAAGLLDCGFAGLRQVG